MTDSGKMLERLVAEIERHLMPEGFSVEVNERIIEDGVQIAEFDIVITGQLGSSMVKWLIECRDRPSYGPAPGSWIEQLVGRRRRFNYDKVIAVSTTGFAGGKEGAMEYAAKEGILLRTVETITDLTDDFEVAPIPVRVLNIKINGLPQVKVSQASDEQFFVESHEYRFRVPGKTSFLTLPSFITQRLVDHPVLEVAACREVGIDYKHTDPVDVLIDGEHNVRVRSLAVPIRLSMDTTVSKALCVRVYSEGSRLIGQEAEFEADTAEGIVRHRFQAIDTQDGKREMKMLFPHEWPTEFGDTIIVQRKKQK